MYSRVPIEMKSLRLAMIAHGIPVQWTHRLANALDIQGVEDLATVQFDMIIHVPTEFRHRIMDLRNFYRDDDATLWTYYD